MAHAKHPTSPAGDESSPALALAWDDLIGMDDVLAAWRRLVAEDRLPPVLLITGREGLGKRLLLAALAAMHVCETGVACGACAPCRLLQAGTHPELLWLESETGKLMIEDASALQEHVALSAARDVRARLAVMVDADQMTTQAANRLLKTLEEPPPRTRILMSSSRPQALLPTVLSRCVRWRVMPPSSEETLAWLARRLQTAGHTVPRPETLAAYLKRAGLAPGVALKLALADTGDDEATLASWRPNDRIGAALQKAEVWARQSGLNLGELLARIEYELNDSYARGTLPSAVSETTARREILRETRRLAVAGKVPLNAQLALESLFLAGHDVAPQAEA